MSIEQELFKDVNSVSDLLSVVTGDESWVYGKWKSLREPRTKTKSLRELKDILKSLSEQLRGL